MKNKLRFLLATLLLVAGTAVAKDVTRVPAPEGVLPVVVTENTLGNSGSAYTDFDRLDLALQAVAKERKWPLKIAADRMASGAPDYLTELRISIRRVEQEIPGEYVYRAWTTLWIDGKKHDFQVIRASYNYRLGENMDDILNKVFRQAAKTTADKIEPLLFPDLKAKK